MAWLLITGDILVTTPDTSHTWLQTAMQWSTAGCLVSVHNSTLQHCRTILLTLHWTSVRGQGRTRILWDSSFWHLCKYLMSDSAVTAQRRLTKLVLVDAVMLPSQDIIHHRPKYMQGLRLFSLSTSLEGGVNTLKLFRSKGNKNWGSRRFCIFRVSARYFFF